MAKSTLLLAIAAAALRMATAAQASTTPLEVAVVVFATESTPSTELDRSAEIALAEARIFAVQLRDALEQASPFGPVRVLPSPSPSSELTVTGRIIASDGVARTLQIDARDSTGRSWIRRRYRGVPMDVALEAAVRPDGVNLNQQIVTDLLQLHALLTPGDLDRIVETAELRYARELAPKVFADYLNDGPGSAVALVRLPARDDPMLERVLRVRESEYAFIDAVDLHYRDLTRRIIGPYTRWLESNRRDLVALEQLRDQATDPDKDRRRGIPGSRQRYSDYRESKYIDASVRQLAAAFDFEVAPTVVQVEAEVIKLSGSVDHQYDEWRQLLHAIWDVETGGAATLTGSAGSNPQ